LFSADEVSIMVILRNKGEITLHNISLDTQSNAPNVSLSLSDVLFDRLGIGEEKTTLLNIKSLVDEKARIGRNRYFVVLNAHVKDPIYDTLTRFFVDVEEIDYELRMENLLQIQFAQDLFKEHPECLEFNEVVRQAEDYYDDYDYRGSIGLIDSAIKACRALIVYAEGEYPETGLGELEKPGVKEKKDNILLLIEIIILMAIMLGLLYYYRKRKRRKPKRPERLAKTNVEIRFEEVFKETRKFMRVRNFKSAKQAYANLCYIYKTMKTCPLPEYVKSDSYQKLLVIRSKLLKRVRKKF
jgi:hypothetical protein